jgi:anti-anti-sigma factor
MCSEPRSARQKERTEREVARGALRLRSGREPTCHVVALAGELDLASASLLEEEMAKALAADAPAIVLDLSELRFIDSTGIRLLLRLQARSPKEGNRLRMIRGTAQVQRALELTGADRVLPFLGVEPAASASA